MKICFLIGSVFSLGGVQRVTTVIANELLKKHEVHILCMENEFKEDRSLYNLYEKVQVTVWNKSFNRSFSKKIRYKLVKNINTLNGYYNKKKYLETLTNAYYIEEVEEELINFLNNNKYDVVIGVEGYYSLLLGKIAHKLKAKTIGWQHNSYEAYLKNKGRYYFNRDVLFEEYIPKLDKYIVLNEHDKEMFKKEKDIETTVLYNPTSFKSEEKSNLNNKVFLAAGRFNYQKGFDLLVESFKIFASKDKEWELLIVGEGEEKENIAKKIKQYNLEHRIKLMEFTDNIKEYFLRSSTLLLSSRWEGMPMIVLESMEMGVPVIAYDITAMKPLIHHEKQGLIIEKYNIDMFAEAMIKISESKELRSNLGNNAKEKAKDFSIDRIVYKWNELLDGVVLN